MPILNGVIRKIDNVLIRYGYCDFINDGSFQIADEEQHEIPPGISIYSDDIMNTDSDKLTHWDGNEWELIDRLF